MDILNVLQLLRSLTDSDRPYAHQLLTEFTLYTTTYALSNYPLEATATPHKPIATVTTLYAILEVAYKYASINCLRCSISRITPTFRVYLRIRYRHT